MSPDPTIRVHTLIDSLGFGGAEALLADMVAAAPEAHIEASVAFLREPSGGAAAEALRAHGTEPTYVPVGRVLDLRGARRLRDHLRAVRPDILHTHLSLADTLGTVAASSLRIPSISTIHLIASAPALRADHERRRSARSRLAALARTHATGRVIAVSDAARDAYLATGWDKPAHVITVHNGILAPPAPTTPPARVRAELDLRTDELVVTTLSVLRAGKGHDVALDALSRLLPRFPALRLLILGDGPERDQIARYAEPLGPNVVMAGHRADVMAILGATDVLLHATTMDAYPTALLEAAAARVPVVATRVGGIPEIVRDGQSGLLVDHPPSVGDVADKLSTLLADDARRRRLGEYARTLFDQRFTASRWVLELRGVYDEVLERDRPRGTIVRGIRSRQRS